MTVKTFREGTFEIIDRRINDLMSKQNEVKEHVSLYLPEEVRNFTWGVRRMMLINSFDGRDEDEVIEIRRLLDDISNRSDIMLELLNLKNEIKGMGK